MKLATRRDAGCELFTSYSRVAHLAQFQKITHPFGTMENDGTLDYYRQLAETNPDIQTLVALIDKLADQLTLAVSAAIKP